VNVSVNSDVSAHKFTRTAADRAEQREWVARMRHAPQRAHAVDEVGQRTSHPEPGNF
jgi:hypothetical protein